MKRVSETGRESLWFRTEDELTLCRVGVRKERSGVGGTQRHVCAGPDHVCCPLCRWGGACV